MNTSHEFKSNFLAKFASFRIPWLFDRLISNHIVIRTPSNASADIVPQINGMIAQILASYPPGTVRFLLIGKVKNFASFHALGDYDKKLITNEVWTEPKDIRGKLEEIAKHIKEVDSNYLRDEFKSIDQYNKQAGEIAEAYRFVFIHDFPESFDSEACLSLKQIMEDGPRCGVHVVMVWDEGKKLPHGIESETLIQHAELYSEINKNELKLAGPDGLESNDGISAHFTLDTPPAQDVVKQIVEKHRSGAENSSRVEVPYDKLMQRVMDDDVQGRWSRDNTRQLAAPLGPTGAREIQQLVFGADGFHALLIGETGSGKSNLLHVLIVSLAELYSPEQLEVFLVDFKQGVEFNDYAVHKLPHARVVALDSEFEFGLSVLRGMADEMKKRGDIFGDAGVPDITAYREKTGKTMPRTLLIVDEFRGLFVEKGATSDEASSIVAQIATQGRGYGMHMVLASQSLRGIQIPVDALGQLRVRIAMKCNEEDSRKVLDNDNGAARLLERAGEAIYNNNHGSKEANNRFQAAFLTDDERKSRLVALRKHADEAYASDPKLAERFSSPFIFKGSKPADFSACRPLGDALREWPNAKGSAALNLWVGEPISMSPAHTINLKRQSGANLLVIDRNEELAFGVVFSSILSVAAQESPETGVFHIVDMSSTDASWVNHAKTFASNFPHGAEIYGGRVKGVIPKLVSELVQEIDYRKLSDSTQMAKIILVLFGVQRASDLERPDNMSFTAPTADGNVHDNLGRILREGPEFGIHTIIWCDTVSRFSLIFDNSALNEIGHRIAGGLPSADSIKLFDEPVASKFDQKNRMICYDDEKIGIYTPIRPYLPCSVEYVKELGRDTKRLLAKR